MDDRIKVNAAVKTRDPVIRQARIEDLEAASKLFDRYRQFYKQPEDIEGARRFIRARIESGDSIISLASLEYGDARDPAGFIQLYPSFSSIAMRRSWILNDLFVDPVHRKSGIARRLLEWARRLAETTGAAELTLMTAKSNTTAQALYSSMGWKVDEEFLSFNLDL